MAILWASSCLEEDTTPPDVEGLTLTTGEGYVQDATSETVNIPGDIRIEGAFSDDVLLLQFITTLDANFETNYPLSNQTSITQVDTFYIAGNASVADRKLTVSNEAASGKYTLNFVASDERENEANLGPFEINIQNNLPFIGLNMPTTDSVALPQSEVLNIEGLVSAHENLSTLTIELTTDSTEFLVGSFSDIKELTFTIDTSYTSTEKGLHELVISAEDSLGNKSEQRSLVNFL
ncbi:hypothetical protein R9C00_27700 [Flammeovirgaceae bacterium SG7u.111]|nr:hypothetical protein [Flammeovirgaceae bacterium SG7u.132]WPO35486.1 hypothetical protein R9C00_27700 [Flammeovirgaceae bacterium SG7u.111]